MDECFHAWKALKIWDLQLHQQSEFEMDEECVKSFVYNNITYSTYNHAWKYCQDKISLSYSFPYFYDDSFLSTLFFLTEDFTSLFKQIEEDVRMLVIVTTAPEGRVFFLSLLQKMESFLIVLLGHAHSSCRFFAIVLLNALYDGHFWQFTSAFPVTIVEVNDSMSLPFSLQFNESLVIASPQKENDLDIDLSCRHFKQYNTTENLPSFSLPGYYDWIVMDIHSEEIINKGRFIVLPSGTKQHHFYEIPCDFEYLQRTNQDIASQSILQLVTNQIPSLLEKGMDVIILSPSQSHANSLYISNEIDSDYEQEDSTNPLIGLALSSVESSPAEETEELYPSHSFHSSFFLSSSGMWYGSQDQLECLLIQMKEKKMRFMIPINTNACLQDAHNHEVVYFFEDDERKRHPGTDGRETQWENEVLPNYRNRKEWNGLIERMIRYYHDYHIDSFYLQEGQSLPLFLQTDYNHCHSLQDLIEGCYVYCNEESGYWACKEASDLHYPNPYLVKLIRKLYELCPDILICSNAYWHRSESLLQCGLLPICSDFLFTLCKYTNIYLSKNGMIEEISSPPSFDCIDDLTAFTHNIPSFVDGSSYFIHFLCNDVTPYPSMTLKRATWPAVCLLYTLPSKQLCYYREDEGHCIKVTQGDEFMMKESSNQWNDELIEDNIEVMTLSSSSTKWEPHYSTRMCRKIIHFHCETDLSISEVYLVGSFNDWNPHQDAMILCKTEKGQNCFDLYLELYSGLYYYKFYFPSQQYYTHDLQNPNRVADPYGGFNSVLEIPIQTQLKHPLLQTAQMKADIWWHDLTTSDNPSSKLSYNNLGIINSDNPSVKKVTSWLKLNSSDSLSDKSSCTTPSFSLSYTELDKLPRLENSVRSELGPQYGFDLFQINQHYDYFRSLRNDYPILERGSFLPLHLKPSSMKILAFCRYEQDSIFIVITSFEAEPQQVTLCLDELYLPILNMSKNTLVKDGLWLVHKIRENIDCFWSDQEIKSREIQFSLLPFDYSLIFMEYKREITQEERFHYIKQGFDDLENIFSSTRAIGQQFYQNQPVWNNHMIKEEEILQQCNNNSIFTTICGYLEDFILKEDEEIIISLLSWYLNICSICQITELKRQGQVLRNSLFYASYRYNAENHHHKQITTTTRNDLILHCLQHLASSNLAIASLSTEIIEQNQLGPIVVITPELGKWSTVGGLGVMVDNLTKALARQGQEVIVISPYYDKNRYGQSDYLKKDGIFFEKTIPIQLPSGETIEVGFHRGIIQSITYIFFHHAATFMRPYPSGSPAFLMQCQILMALAPLTYCSIHSIAPSIILTNDWPCGLVATYARLYYSSTSIANASFFHIIHNLDDSYEGRIYPQGNDSLSSIHHIPIELLQDPYWHANILNPSRCVLLSTDNWGTVSTVYQEDIQHNSALAPLLRRFPQPFSSPNGVYVFEKKLQYASLPTRTHNTAKLYVQKKYFGYENLSIPLLVFVGRITEQKGVHLICEMAEELIVSQNRNIQIIVGGIANEEDPYGRYCMNRMNYLRTYYGDCFWANPHEFFTDGFVCNLAADFGLMPSLFEPCGIVQDEFFAAGTPVIAFSTGGLKETIHDWHSDYSLRNGFLFLHYGYHDFLNTIHRALAVYFNRNEYDQLRQMTVLTTVDVNNQARDYISEFYRMRRCLLPSIAIPFSFPISLENQPTTVLLVGDFTNWSEKPIEMKKKGNEFVVVVSLTKGDYRYKYLVDGRWCTNPLLTIYKDENNNENHIISVPESTNISISRVINRL